MRGVPFAALSIGFLLAGELRAQGVRPNDAEVISPGREVPDASRGNAVATFGVKSLTVLPVGAYEFERFYSNAAIDGLGGTFERFLSAAGSGGYLVAALHLPSGALVTHLELNGCDDSNSGSVSWEIFEQDGDTESGVSQGAFQTGVASMPGCGLFVGPIAHPFTVDNFRSTYTAQVLFDEVGTATRFTGLRVYYRLQISPAPATATFGDVPTSYPYFQAVEALAASGITAGCGSGNFCPGQNVTRGEMAVFLARALGLHWPD